MDFNVVAILKSIGLGSSYCPFNPTFGSRASKAIMRGFEDTPCRFALATRVVLARPLTTSIIVSTLQELEGTTS